MATLFITTAVTLVVGAIGGAVIEASKGWASRWVGAKRAERRRQSEGDHIAINSGTGIRLDSGTSEVFRAGIEVAPSVSFHDGVALDPAAVAAWVERLLPAISTHRQHHDPEDLIRYIDGFTVLNINAKGRIELLIPVRHLSAIDGSADSFRLDIDSLVRVITPIVAAVADGGYESIYRRHLITSKVDWRFSVSRYVNAQAGTVPWSGLVFTGRPPRSDTPGQLAPTAGEFGFGGPALRNLDVRTPPSEVVMKVLQSLVERAGYSGLADCLADLRRTVDGLVASQTSSVQQTPKPD